MLSAYEALCDHAPRMSVWQAYRKGVGVENLKKKKKRGGGVELGWSQSAHFSHRVLPGSKPLCSVEYVLIGERTAGREETPVHWKTSTQLLWEKSLPRLCVRQGQEPGKPLWLLLCWAICRTSHVQVCKTSPEYNLLHGAVGLRGGQHPLTELVNLNCRLILNLQPFRTYMLLKWLPCLSKGQEACCIAWECTYSWCCGGVGHVRVPALAPALLTGTSQQRGGEPPLHPFASWVYLWALFFFQLVALL